MSFMSWLNRAKKRTILKSPSVIITLNEETIYMIIIILGNYISPAKRSFNGFAHKPCRDTTHTYNILRIQNCFSGCLRIIIIIILFIERRIQRAVRGAVQDSKAALSVIINIQVKCF